MKVTRTFDLLDRMAANFDKEVIIAGKQDGKWKTYSTRQYIEKVNHFSYGLLALGIKSGDKIVTVSNSRPEWNIMDMGMAQVGAVHVALYPNLTEEEYTYLLSHSGCRAVVVGNRTMYNRLKKVSDAADNVELFFTIDDIDSERNLSEICALGEKHQDEYKEEVERIKSGITEEDLLSIIYTSGTTGTAKGVMLAHRSVVTNAIATSSRNKVDENDKAISFLPLCHIYERMVNYHYQYKGVSIYYAQNLGTVMNDLRDVQADTFSTVPRFLEKVYDNIIAEGKDLTGIKNSIFFRAVRLGEKFDPSKNYGSFYRFKLKMARQLIFDKWRAALGGEIRVIITGGAAMQERLCRIFSAAGISIQEGYGLTETGPVIAVNGWGKEEKMIGTVGLVLDGVDCKIAEDGEILCKGPNVMLGYYKDQEYTAEVVDEDGWFHTGDIGTLINGQFLKVTDRKKSIFKLSSGKYIAPQVIENKLKASGFIEQALVVGRNEKFAAAIISPAFDYLHFWAAKHKINYRDNEELTQNPSAIGRIQKEVAIINKTLAPHEQVKKIKVVVDEWTLATGELSQTLKVKREVLIEKYQAGLEEIFGHPYNARQ
ncbi:long-chain fatty acid--CoA ligase [Prolixibacter sp. SD074]|uniref:AMP-dependent synthetase/ligase n=1 Tax=Prolixibacter sp. SD074 TaxID=2652391 RepID=UPI0012777CAD|nr:long-chain fatty acid--CoA ligase [Prolixibacter sp. SD074]GET30051.1 AMP-dependent synthetase [Prolixibacter sp. SD074]